jgi:hypothetical protein
MRALPAEPPVQLLQPEEFPPATTSEATIGYVSVERPWQKNKLQQALEKLDIHSRMMQDHVYESRGRSVP